MKAKPFYFLTYYLYGVFAGVIHGPAEDAKVDPDSDKKPAWKLEKEHRTSISGLTLPDRSLIQEKVREQLGVDNFFSLWYVFLNDEVKKSSIPFTILAPVNSSKSNLESLLGNEELTEEIIVNHIILGKIIQPESLLRPQNHTSLGGKDLFFKLDDQGEIWVNGVRILGWSLIQSKGIVFSIEKYLFENEMDKNTTEQPSTLKPFVVEARPIQKENCVNEGVYSPLVKGLILCTNEVLLEKKESPDISDKEKNKNITTDSTTEKDKLSTDGTVRTKPNRPKNEENKTVVINFAYELAKFIKDNERTTQFKKYIKQYPEVADSINVGKFYEAFIPSDEAFQSWYPIDWGFNPFLVPEFVRGVLLESFSTNSANKSRLDPEVRTPSGNIYIIDYIPGLNLEGIKTLQSRFGYLETGPPVKVTPWSSPFLIHVLRKLDKTEKYTHFADYLDKSMELDQLTPEIKNPTKKEGYTMFVPKDDAVWRLFIKDEGAPDPFFLDDEFRYKTLANHVFTGRFVLDDLNNGTQINSIGGEVVSVIKESEDIFLNDGKQKVRIIGPLESSPWVYNFGTLFVIDKVLFTETSDVIKIMEKHSSFISTVQPSTLEIESMSRVNITQSTIPEKLLNNTNKTESLELATETVPTKPVKRFRKAEDFNVHIGTATKIVYVNNKRLAILKEDDFDTLFFKD